MGCTIRGYEGERLPKDERAVIVSHCASAVDVRIEEISGRRLDLQWSQGGKLELAPGGHRISLRVTWAALGKTAWLSWGLIPWLAVNEATERRASFDVLVNVKPGRRYVFTASVTSREMPVYAIVDAETDELVAGRHRPGFLALQQ